MPTVPSNTKCSVLGCKNKRSKFNSFCTEHGGRDTYNHKQYDKAPQRREQIAMYQTPQWLTLRKIQLSTKPLCASCLSQGIVTQAVHIDHVFPWQKIGQVAFYHNLFQSLCTSCHSSKTHLEQRGIFRRYGNPNRDYTLDDYTRACIGQRSSPPESPET